VGAPQEETHKFPAVINIWSRTLVVLDNKTDWSLTVGRETTSWIARRLKLSTTVLNEGQS
jgi:hypothetical protein